MDIFIRNTNYRKFSLASWLSSAGNILFYLALMTYASRLKNYSLALSLIAITESLPNLIQSLSGYLADRTKNKYHVIVWLAIIRFALYLLVGLLFATNISGWNLVLMVIGLNFISDLSGKYSGGLQTPLIVSLVGENEMSEAHNGISQLITMIAQFAGSGLLLFMSYSGLAIVNAITFLVAGIIYANIGMNVKKQEVNKQPEEVNTQKFGATIVSSLKQVKQANGLLTIVLVIALLNGLLSTVEPLISIVLVGNKNMLIGNYSFTIAVVSTVAAIGMASGSAIGTKIFKNTSLFLIVLADTIATITLAIVIIYGNIFASLFCLAILGFLAGIVSPKLLQWLVTTVDRKILSSSVGLLNTILVMAGPLTTTVFTSIASATNITYALYGIIILGIAVFITISIVLLKINKAD